MHFVWIFSQCNFFSLLLVFRLAYKVTDVFIHLSGIFMHIYCYALFTLVPLPPLTALSAFLIITCIPYTSYILYLFRSLPSLT